MITPNTTISQEPPTTDWQHHVDACKHSGLSKAQYCREHQLIYHLFIYWNTKLGGATRQPAQSAGKLVPVKLADQAAGSHATSTSHGLQIHLPNGVHVSGIDSRSVGLVGQLIQQL